ncbi:peptidoglycan-binding protein [Xylanimonas allomyrinae]|uniref:peptidoglycan-binding protein n=1 Tax=Xylanimonas allomyrinae TaxID=2509459 RepID=UPI0013A626E2|nr:peptidoglycan-binding protein [Xylanimonas allomyrinae]
MALVVVGVGAWAAAARLESPDQAAANAQPPAPAPLTAVVRAGYLHGAVTIAVTVEPQQVRSQVAPAALTGVVTAQVVAPGDVLRPGAPVLRVDGRPLFVLPGDFPLYRDIEPGDQGDDVAALQEGLRAAGFFAGRTDGSYGPRTQAAVKAMYQAAGYEVPRATVEVPVPPAADPQAGAAAGGGDAAEAEGVPADAVPADVPDPAGTRTVPGGPRVLRSEVLMVGGLPATVRSLAAVGSQLAEGAAVFDVTVGDLVLATTVPGASAGVLAVGAEAVFAGDEGDARASVTAIDHDAETGDARIVLTVSEGVISAGITYTVTIENPAGEDEAGLLVPVTAVVSRGGVSSVYVADGDSFREVAVTVAGQQGGVAAVEALDPDAGLVAGASVRIGPEAAGAPADTADATDG